MCVFTIITGSLGATTNGGFIQPTSATNRASFAFSAKWVGAPWQFVSHQIAAPLPDVAMHVVQAPRIRFLLLHLMGITLVNFVRVAVIPSITT